ncbi:MAG: hypothetical protein WCK49_01625 [Myxococcaceae bacterium]
MTIMSFKFLVISIFSLLALVGCGKKSTTNEDDAFANSKAFSFNLGAGGASKAINTKAAAQADKHVSMINKDATVITISGGGSDGSAHSASDTSIVECSFSLDPSQNGHTADGTDGVEIVLNSSGNNSACTNKAACVVCAFNSDYYSQSCSISCNGMVPANARVARDSLNFVLTYTTTIIPSAGSGTGAIAFAHQVPARPDWLTSGPTTDYSSCRQMDTSNSDLFSVLGEGGTPWNVNNSNSYYIFSDYGYTFNGAPCSATFTYKGTIYLGNGSSTAGGAFSYSTYILDAFICDYPSKSCFTGLAS